MINSYKIIKTIINECPICFECEFIEYQDDEYGCGVKGYTYDAGYLTKEIYLWGHTFWFKTYYYEFIVYFDETDKVKSILMQEPLRLGVYNLKKFVIL